MIFFFFFKGKDILPQQPVSSGFGDLAAADEVYRNSLEVQVQEGEWYDSEEGAEGGRGTQEAAPLGRSTDRLVFLGSDIGGEAGLWVTGAV